MRGLQHPIVSILVERASPDGPEILIQRRLEPGDPLDGVLELPQGGIEWHESLVEAAARELREESGLRLLSLVDGGGQPIPGSRELQALRPLACVHDVENGFIGLAFVGSADGTPHDTTEADHHHWVDVRDLPAMLERERIFPLNVPMIREYVRTPTPPRATDTDRGAEDLS